MFISIPKFTSCGFKIDDDPRNPSYIAAQGPLMHTTNDFWQMVWEEESVVIVSLCRTIEYGSAKCYQFWPGNGACVYDKFEVGHGFIKPLGGTYKSR